MLAHVVASRTGATRAAVDEDLGLLRLVPSLPEGSTMLLVATAFTPFRTREALRGVIANNGHTVVGVVDLSDPSAATPPPATA